MKILSGVLFVLGMLLLGLTVLVFTGDAGAAAQIDRRAAGGTSS